MSVSAMSFLHIFLPRLHKQRCSMDFFRSFILISCISIFPLQSESEFYKEIGVNEQGYYSQFCQDRFLNEMIFDYKNSGIFVDIGAHNGVSYSNTKYFEDRGWQGICIEPIPLVFQELKNNRKAICINGCISDKIGTLSFCKVNGESEMLSGLIDKFDPQHVDRIKTAVVFNGGSYETIMVNCFLLNQILEEHNIFHIDYLTIDTEGGELDILRSIDFSKFDIDIIDVENNYGTNFFDFLTSKGYEFVVQLGCDEIYKKVR